MILLMILIWIAVRLIYRRKFATAAACADPSRKSRFPFAGIMLAHAGRLRISSASAR